MDDEYLTLLAELEAKTAQADAIMNGQEPPVDMAAPAPEAGPAPVVPTAPQPSPPPMQVAEADPEMVEQATSRMVEAGAIAKITGEMTPEVVAVLHASVEAVYPGLLDFADPNDLEEALKGVINGRIPVEQRGKLADADRAAATGPQPGGGLPGSGPGGAAPGGAGGGDPLAALLGA